MLGFQPPAIGDEEIEAVAETLRSGWLTTGPRSAELERRFAEFVEAEHVLAVASGTAALHLALGVDLNGLALQAALGEPLWSAALQPTPEVGGAVVRFLVPPEGVLEEVEGTDEARAVEGVQDVRVYREPGHVFGPFRRGADRAGAVLAVGDSREEALQRAEEAARLIRFKVSARSLV